MPRKLTWTISQSRKDAAQEPRARKDRVLKHALGEVAVLEGRAVEEGEVNLGGAQLHSHKGGSGEPAPRYIRPAEINVLNMHPGKVEVSKGDRAVFWPEHPRDVLCDRGGMHDAPG